MTWALLEVNERYLPRGMLTYLSRGMLASAPLHHLTDPIPHLLSAPGMLL